MPFANRNVRTMDDYRRDREAREAAKLGVARVTMPQKLTRMAIELERVEIGLNYEAIHDLRFRNGSGSIRASRPGAV